MSELIFQGRTRIPGEVHAPAVVSAEPVDLPAALTRTLRRHRASACGRAAGELAHKKIADTALCAPCDTGKMVSTQVLESAASYGAAPACILLAGEASDPLIAGAALSMAYTQWPLPVIDRLGDEFLAAVRNGERLTVRSSGEVVVGVPQQE